MKSRIAVLVALFALLATPVVSATLDTGLSYGTFTSLGTKDVREGVMSIVTILLGFLGLIVVVGILYGGFVYMTAGGNEEKTGKGKTIMAAGIIGLVIVFSAYAIAAFVIGQLISATGAA